MKTLSEELPHIFKKLESCGFKSAKENERAINIISVAVSRRVEKVSDLGVEKKRGVAFSAKIKQRAEAVA